MEAERQELRKSARWHVNCQPKTSLPMAKQVIPQALLLQERTCRLLSFFSLPYRNYFRLDVAPGSEIIIS